MGSGAYLTRRQAILATAAGVLSAAPESSRLSLQGYIWQNYASREKKPLAELIGELFATARYAGFKNIELDDGFFTPALGERVIQLTRQHKLSMPSVYVGGGLLDRERADRTIAKAIEIGEICREFSCRAIVNNPDTKPQNGRRTDDELAFQAESLNRM